MSRMLIACGGTGGHLAPGIALAQRLTEDQCECLLIVSRKSVDARMTAKYPSFRFVAGRGRGFGPGFIGRILFFPSFLAALWSSWRLIRSFRPDIFICFGGFLSLAPAFVCRLCGIPVLVHEANRKPGKAVRLIARIAHAVYVPDGVRIPSIPSERHRSSGYPVRVEICPQPRDAARRALGLPVSGRLLLVAGGSQGASVLNRWVEDNLETFAIRGVHILCLTGPGGRADDVRTPESVVKFMPFCDQMEMAYSAADLAVTRAGAGTLAELATCRIPSVLVPYPLATDNHQTANAEYLVQRDGAVLLPEADIARLTITVLSLINDSPRLSGMRDALSLVDSSNQWMCLANDVTKLAREDRARRI